jgi:hypothetical protein
MVAVNKFRIEGNLLMSSEKILVKSKIIEKEFSVKNLKKLKFHFSGVAGSRYLLNLDSILFKNGTDNFIYKMKIMQNINLNYFYLRGTCFI